jgi:AraC-like DNA-binding protein
MTIYIKNMVSVRCKMFVRAELAHIGLYAARIDLGQVEIIGDISVAQRHQIKLGLSRSGLELIDDTKSVLVEKIKCAIIELVHYSDEPLSINLSAHLSQHLRHNYTYMANIFAEKRGQSIERFFIEHKIERVKELLHYDELNLTEIAYKMHYSSVAHLSHQFKKVTGNTASQYKHLHAKTRVMLESI